MLEHISRSWTDRTSFLTISIAALAALLLLDGCPKKLSGGGSGSGSGNKGGKSQTPYDPPIPTPRKGTCDRHSDPLVVHFKTEDGVMLEADFYAPGMTKMPAAVLLHMIPPKNNRTNFPRSFIDALVGRGFNVLNVDRRGAGRSKGEAKAAYKGDKGKLDAKAAFHWLSRHPCQIDTKRVVFVGASNGTTTALDFTVLAKADPSVEWPRALVFLSGGTYTENQNRIAQHRDLLDSIPILFVYPKSERSWNVIQKEKKAGVWQFKEIEGTAHGTHLFDAELEAVDQVAKFMIDAVKSEGYK